MIFQLLVLLLCGVLAAGFNVGVGIWDITGPAVEINFMGYAVPGQRGTGIHLRLRARAFLFQESSDKQDKVVFVSCDGGMASDLVKMRVLDQLASKFGEGVFTNENVAISGTHSHSGPGGYLQYVLYQTTSLGYVDETFQAWVNGITQAIIMANDNIVEDATLTINTGTLVGANINRSPTSYLANPQAERDMYPDGDTDKLMTLLKITKKYPGGAASYQLEKQINGENGAKIALPGDGPFVAAFASTNLGDVSPNTNGAKCIDTGLPCDGTTSTCNGRCENCIAFGPGYNGDMVQSTQIIATRQVDAAKGLMDSATEQVVEGTNGVAYQHSFVQFSILNVTLATGQTVQLCKPAMGYSFASGTTDGPGMFGFKQHTTTTNPFWNKVTDFLSEPTPEEIACQLPKPILINTADINKPYEWDPTTLPIQMFKIGNLFIVSVPSEFTTMAGRRMRKAVEDIVQPMLPAGQTAHVVISGLCNGYSSYVTTEEEYAQQRYEAASTIFGPNTLAGYIQEMSRIARDLVKGTPSVSGPPPKDMQSQMVEMMPGVKFDLAPPGSKFGEVKEDVNTQTPYHPTVFSSAGTMDGSAPSDDTSPLSHVQVTFHAANPRNNQKIQSTFLTVEKQDASSRSGWSVVRTDGDWDTTFHWIAGYDDKYAFGISPFSRSIVTWNLNRAQQEMALNGGGGSLAGTYRICYSGDHKELVGKKHRIVPFSGCSSVFTVTDN